MLKLENLQKKFGGKAALKGLSFEVGKGEIYGLLGHNGAGKSTALGIVLGMVSADAGQVSIGGVSVLRERSKALRKAGAIFEAPGFYEYLSGWENLRLLTTFSGTFDKKNTREVVERVGLTERIGSKVSAYSHGMRQRLALAQALLPEPEILLLDEPTDGLDPEGIKWFRDFILRLRDERGMTVLFNSHQLFEVEQMCDRVAMIRSGEMVFEGEVGDLTEDGLTLKLAVEPRALLDEVLRDFSGRERGNGRYFFPEGTVVEDLVAALVGRGGRVSEMTPLRRSLEDVYMEFVS